jgi:hypothetical protein
MNRRYAQREPIDRAEQLEKWVLDLAEKTNERLEGAELIQDKYSHNKRANLCLRNPFEHEGKKIFNGFVSFKIKFEKEPDFMTSEDRKKWLEAMRNIKRKFFQEVSSFDSNYFSIPFEEQSEEELYILTTNKKLVIETGFENAEKFLKIYSSSIRDYQKVIDSHNVAVNKYLSNLEKSSLSP